MKPGQTYERPTLHDPICHEPLQEASWNAVRVRAFIAKLVAETEVAYSAQDWWPPHPLDLANNEDPLQPATPLYFGACGVIWALHYLQDVGAVQLQRNYLVRLDALLQRNRHWLGDTADAEQGSYLLGETPLRLLQFGMQGASSVADRLATLIRSNQEHPARELMWGSPGTLLAALHLHQRTGQARWADLFRTAASRLRHQLVWSEEFQCHYWMQDLYGEQCSFIDAVHGFVGTTLPLIRGRHLLADEDWTT